MSESKKTSRRHSAALTSEEAVFYSSFLERATAAGPRNAPQPPAPKTSSTTKSTRDVVKELFNGSLVLPSLGDIPELVKLDPESRDYARDVASAIFKRNMPVIMESALKSAVIDREPAVLKTILDHTLGRPGEQEQKDNTSRISSEVTVPWLPGSLRLAIAQSSTSPSSEPNEKQNAIDAEIVAPDPAPAG